MDIVLVYDITDKKSFEKLNFWVDNIKNNGPENAQFILVGNKLDEEKNEEKKENIVEEKKEEKVEEKKELKSEEKKEEKIEIKKNEQKPTIEENKMETKIEEKDNEEMTNK